MHAKEKEALVQKLYETYPYPDRGVTDSKDSQRYVSWVTKIFDNPNTFWKGKSVLELGCGTGELAVGLATCGANVHAIDLSKNSITKAISNAKKLGVTVNFEQQNILTFIEQNKNKTNTTYDVVIALGSLHHTVDARKGFHIGVSHLKKDGIIIIGLYNKYSRFRHRVKRAVLHIFCGKDIEKRIQFGKKYFKGNEAIPWLADKYGQVHESYHSIREILKWFKEENIDYLTSQPKHKTPTIDEIMWFFEKRNAFFVMVGKKK